MKITTLGTSHGSATYCRFNSSTHFALPETSLLVDAGAPVDALMIRKGLQINALYAVLITHVPMIGDCHRSFSFLIESEGKKVLHTGDLTSDFSDFPSITRETRISLCICELTHYKPELAREVLRESKLDKLVFNHVHDPWHGDGEERIKEILGPLPFPFTIAHDGDEFVV